MIDNPTPRYYKIYHLLRLAIENGEYAAEHAMPGENALAQRYGVSRLTIRRSLDLLQREGLVTRRQGSGTYPVEQGVTLQPLHGDINTLAAHLHKMGEGTRVHVLDFDYETPTPAVRTQLELAEGKLVQKSVRVRYHGDTPFSYLLTYVPESIGRGYTRADLESMPLQTLLRKGGVKLGEAEQAFTAIAADAHHADALDVEIASPLLCIRRVTRDTRGQPVESLVAAYNPRRFEYRMVLTNKRTRAADEDIWVPDHAVSGGA